RRLWHGRFPSCCRTTPARVRRRSHRLLPRAFAGAARRPENLWGGPSFFVPASCSDYCRCNDGDAAREWPPSAPRFLLRACANSARRMMSDRPMFWRIIRRILASNRARLAVILLALGSGAVITAALLNLEVDAKRRLTTEFRAFGANVLIAP